MSDVKNLTKKWLKLKKRQGVPISLFQFFDPIILSLWLLTFGSEFSLKIAVKAVYADYEEIITTHEIIPFISAAIHDYQCIAVVYLR